MALLPIYQVLETISGQVITWPAANGKDTMPPPNGATILPSLAVNPGDLIIANRWYTVGPIFSSDGTTTNLRFGSFLDPDTNQFVGTGANNTPDGLSTFHPFSGPYASIAPAAYNEDDENFTDLEVLGQINWNAEKDGSYLVYWRTGFNNVGSAAIPDNIISPNHLSPSMIENGHLSNAQLRVRTVYNGPGQTGGVAYHAFEAVTTTVGQSLEWVTDDGSGDANNYTGSGSAGSAGYFTLLKTAFGVLGGDNVAVSQPIIVESGLALSPDPLLSWPFAGSPARAMIAFCNLFPGGPSKPVVSGSGGNYATGSYSIRFAYNRSLTLLSNQHGGPIAGTLAPNSTSVTLANTPAGLAAGSEIILTGGSNPPESFTVGSPYTPGATTVPLAGLVQYAGHTNASWGTFSQVIETPLSTEATVTLGSGTTNSITFSIPLIPTAGGAAPWDNFVIYVGPYNPAGPTTPSYIQQVPNTDYTYVVGANSIQVTLKHLGASSIISPAFGFSAWPSGTYLAKDPNALLYALQKYAHVSAVPDAKSGNYTLADYKSNSSQVGAGHLPPGSVGPLTLTGAATANGTATPDSGHVVPQYDPVSGDLTWIAAGAGMANPMTAKGDLIYGGPVTGTIATPEALPLARIPGALLASAGVAPVWSFPPAAGSQPVKGSIPYTDASQTGGINWLHAGVANAILTQLDANGTPAWAALASLLGISHVAIVSGSGVGNGSQILVFSTNVTPFFNGVVPAYVFPFVGSLNGPPPTAYNFASVNPSNMSATGYAADASFQSGLTYQTLFLCLWL